MLLWILGPVLGPHLGGTPLDGVPGYGVFPLAYKGFLHYTLPGDAPYWVGALDHVPGDDALDHASTRDELMHDPMHDQLMHDPV